MTSTFWFTKVNALGDFFDGAYFDRFLANYIDIPIIFGTLYLAMVLYVPQNIMATREPLQLKTANIIWNLLLSTFSFVGLFSCAPRLYEMVFADTISGINPNSMRHVKNMTASMTRNIVLPNNFKEGRDVAMLRGSLDTSLCVYHPDLFHQHLCGLMCFLFAVSKIPEMIDTFFLVFQKKRIIFLHWYHHITVMLYCWHAWISPTSSGLYFVVMNFAVHSIMYFYYFMCSIGQRRLVRPFAQLITLLQILQMVVGTTIAMHVFRKDTFGEGCDNDRGNTRLGLLMYFSYFLLFSKLFYDSYISPNRRDKKVTEKPKKA